ncbi:MAG: DEAD/DEAH box helicase [Planctomycetes bacterium]|nr:DEAD/DEAH box helicase [Planctomycetota bacterium]
MKKKTPSRAASNPLAIEFDRVTPDTFEEAIALFYALAFGALSDSVLVKALTEVGMTLPGGGDITSQDIRPYVQALREEDLFVGSHEKDLQCDPDLRWACFDQAQQKGWLFPFGQVLQQVDPMESPQTHLEHRWQRQQFVSLGHACRDIFLAMERKDQAALTHLFQLCREDPNITTLASALFPICIDPFHPEYLSQLNTETLKGVLEDSLYAMLCSLSLNHPIFDYAHDFVLAQANPQSDRSISRLVAHIALRDLFCGQPTEAEALLQSHPDWHTPAMRGMLALLTGNPDLGKKAFTQAHKEHGRGKRATLEYLRSFPAVLHALLLVQSEDLQDQALAQTWLKWTEPIECPYKDALDCLSGLLAFHQGRARPVYDQRAQRGEATALENASLLILFLLRDYCGHTETSRSDREDLFALADSLLPTLKESEAYWPCYQIVTLFVKLGLVCDVPMDEAEQFLNASTLVDLSELWPPKEIWERQIQALEHLVGKSQGKASEGSLAEQRGLRLGWKLKSSWDRQASTNPADTDGSPVAAVVPVEQRITRRGTWTKGREVALNRLKDHHAEGINYLTYQDQAVAKLIRVSANRHYYQSSCKLSVSAAIQALAGHDNVFWEEDPLIPVEIVTCEPQIHIVPKGQNLQITLDPMPYEDGQLRTTLVLQDAPHRLRTVHFLPMHKKIAEILGADGVALPDEDQAKAIERLQGLSKHIAIQSNVAMSADHAKTVKPDSCPILRLQRLGRGLQAEMIVLPLGEGSKRSFAPGLGSRHLIDTVNNTPVQTRRDLALETQHLEQIREQVPVLRDFPHTNFLWHLDEDPTDALTLLEQLHGLPPDALAVQWPKGDRITVRTVSPSQFQLSIRSAKDWFELEGTITVDEDLVIQMRQLLEYLNETEDAFIRISDNQYLALTKQFRHDLNLLKTTGRFKGKDNTLQIHPLAALGLDEWKDEIQRFEADPTFNAHLDRIRALETYHPEIPSTLQAELRPYQREGFVWLARLAQWGVGACLADDMGLGKTVEALALILHRTAQGPSLVVAPTSVCGNWILEIQRFAPTLNAIRFGIDDRGRRQEVLDTLKPFDLLVCTYTGLQQEAEALSAIHFITIVLDEAQAIKNPSTKRSQAAMGLQGDFRMVSTGTPIENRLMELWNLSRFLNPGLLGPQRQFTDRFVRPIEVQSDTLARHTLKSLIAPFVLRRTKNQVLLDLPPRTELLRLVELSPEERALHESLRQRAINRLERTPGKAPGQKHIQVLAELMKLRRCCCNPRLVMPNCGLIGSKLQVFAELVDELRDNHHKALVFSQFVDHLTLLSEHLDAQGIQYQYLDGQTPPKKRQQRINDFQNGQGDLFLISLKAGGTGLNLTAADYVIHMDPWWNPAVEDQASDRAHRIGQTRPVTIYRLVTRNTIEEKIVELHHQKRDLADSLLQGTDTANKLTADDLIALLRQS